MEQVTAMPVPAGATIDGGEPESHQFVIQPSRGWVRFDLRELWHYRDLLYFLTWREISVRYKQTVLGFAWAVLQPLLTMLVFTVFLGRLAKVPSDGIPYPVFSYLGLLPWMYFANALTRSSMSLVANQNLVSKVYFPRILIPLSGTLSALVDFLIAFGILGVLMAWYRIAPAPEALLLVPLSVLTALAATGVGMWLAALNVAYRDVRYVVPFLTQFWMFATPIAYPSSLLHEPWRTVYGLNPMVGVVEGFRWALLGAHTAPGRILIVSSAAALTMFLGGLIYFRRLERTFADIV